MRLQKPSITQRGVAKPSQPMVAAEMAAWRARRQQAMRVFQETLRVEILWRDLRDATDACLRGLVPTDADYAVLAVGGYGRGELAPYSDIDMLILVPTDAESVHPTPPWVAALWDSALVIAQHTHTIVSACEAAQKEHTLASNFYSARFIAGNAALADAFKRRFRRQLTVTARRQFTQAKLHERDVRHTRFEDSRFVLEPHIKEGKGGLRDLQTLDWIAGYGAGVRSMRGLVAQGIISPASHREYRRSYLWFSQVRAMMHCLQGRAEERLSFALQTSVATALKLPGKTAQARAEKLMLHYFAATRITGNVTREMVVGLEAAGLHVPPQGQAIAQTTPLHEGLEIHAGRLHFTHRRSFKHRPQDALKIFLIAHQMGRDIHPTSLQMIRDALPRLSRNILHEVEAGQVFMEILLGKHPEMVLRKMNDIGLLGAVLPEFGRVVGQMQYDGYHTFTVDEHTLVAVGNLYAIESGALTDDLPTTTQAAREITQRKPLYLAMLCHDLAKGMGGGHAQKGLSVTESIARHLGLTPEEGALAGWLVSEHLLLSEIAFKRDIADAHLIATLVARIQSPERLRLLLMLTVADIRAVGPKIWNNWKASLLRQLYLRILAGMGVQMHAATADASASDTEAWVARFREAGAPALFHVHTDAARAITEVTCVMAYRADYLRLLAGIMAWIGASIVSAKTTLTSSQADSIAIATLGIQDMAAQAFSEPKRLAQLPELLQAAMQGNVTFARELTRRGRIASSERRVQILPEVFFDNSVSQHTTVIEVNAEDRTALLHDILATLGMLQLQVVSAHIATYGQKAVDVFYVKDMYGLRIEHRVKQQQIREGLLTMLDPHRLSYSI
jgi:[protein-PII] uridylyltransferase